MKIFNDLKDAFVYTKSGEFLVFYKGVLFPLKWEYKGSDRTVIFFPGRTDREKKQIPVFQRSSYFNSIDANVVSCFDPTLYWSKTLTLGWFQGRGAAFYADLLGVIVNKIANIFKNKTQNFLLYGTSGGGIPGFNVAKKLNGCTLYVSNIQTDASKYGSGYFKKMVEVSYPNLDETAVIKEMFHRISVLNIDECFNLIYTQNKCDVFHYENHFVPYFDFSVANKKINKRFFLYSDPLTGHNPLPMDSEISIISKILEKAPFEGFLPQGEEVYQGGKVS